VALLASCIAIFMVLLDVTIVNVALPRSSAASTPTSATSSG